MANLLAHYEPASRPVFNASHIVTVSFGLTLTQISDMVQHLSGFPESLQLYVPLLLSLHGVFYECGFLVFLLLLFAPPN